MIKQVLVLRKDLNMRKGKMVSQGAHGSLKFLADKIRKGKRNGNEVTITLSDEEWQWFDDKFTKITCSVDSESALLALVEKAQASNITASQIIDAGKTEFKGVPTLTCASFGPANADQLDQITGHLPLL